MALSQTNLYNLMTLFSKLFRTSMRIGVHLNCTYDSSDPFLFTLQCEARCRELTPCNIVKKHGCRNVFLKKWG